MTELAYCCFTDKENIGDYSLFQANKILFDGFDILPSDDAIGVNVNLFGGGTVYPYCLRYGTYERKSIEVAIGLGVIDPDFSGKFGPLTWYAMKYGRKLSYFGVRGPHSKRILGRYGIETTITGDTALIHRCDQIITPDQGVIGINFVGENMDRLGQNGKVSEAIVGFCKKCVSDGYKIVLIPFCRSDIDGMLQIKNSIEGVSVLDFWSEEIGCDLGKFFAEMKKCSFFVTERLHASIFAAFLDIPFLSIAYKPKCYDFVDSLNLDKNVIFSPKTIDANSLYLGFNKLKNDTELFGRVGEEVSGYRAALQQAADEIKCIITERT